MNDNFSELSLLQYLEDLAGRLQIGVRYESLADEEIFIHSGGCKVSGRNLIIVDQHLPPLERARILARELSRYDLEAFYLLPIVREFILLHALPREKNLPQR